MSTCSSTSEQSIQSTQSNGVRALLLPSVAPTNTEAEGGLVCPVCLPSPVLLQPALLICPYFASLTTFTALQHHLL